MRFLSVGSHVCARASSRHPLAGLPLPSASSCFSPFGGHLRYSYRGLSPHQFMPMPGVHNSMQRTALHAAADAERVCRAWHEASRVPVPTPGVRRTEDEPKGQGVAVRLGLRRANGAVRAAPAASSFAVADDVAIVFGGQERPGPQQEGEEGEPARGGIRGHLRRFSGLTRSWRIARAWIVNGSCGSLWPGRAAPSTGTRGYGGRRGCAERGRRRRGSGGTHRTGSVPPSAATGFSILTGNRRSKRALQRGNAVSIAGPRAALGGEAPEDRTRRYRERITPLRYLPVIARASHTK